MAGRLGANLRSGNMAEALGVLLLKGIAAVADVPRTEDVGLDAVASLLRYDDGNCYAEDSFVVQFKAESVSEIEYSEHSLDWFFAQEQPMFMGRVSMARSSVALHPTIIVNQAVPALRAKKVTIKFGTSGLPALLEGNRFLPWAGGDNESVTVWLGEPLLEWSIVELTDRSWRERAYAILKHFIRLARRERELLSFGQWTALDWSTNDLASIKSGPLAMKGGPADLREVGQRCIPGLQALMLRALGLTDEERIRLMPVLICLSATLRDYGIDADPENIFARIFVAHSKPA
jgi:hypothetical protein